PDVPAPEDLPSEKELLERLLPYLPDNMRSYWVRERPIEVRFVDPSRYFEKKPRSPLQMVWMRATGRLADSPTFHQCVLAYASDFTLLDTALIPHGRLAFETDIQLASLDHAMWFHRPFRADEWLLYVQDSPNAHGARGFCRGSVYTRDGKLVATAAQEGLIRLKATAYTVS
ncbi:MAG: acyl-CoA thioesterase, partial [Hyphomicrobiaceae bacterium]